MKFDDEYKVIVDSMNTPEARAFVLFLKSEIVHHQIDIDNALSLCYTIINKFHLNDMWEE